MANWSLDFVMWKQTRLIGDELVAMAGGNKGLFAPC